MNQFSDQVLARSLLETRERGYSFADQFRRSLRRYFLLVGYFVFVLVVFALLQRWMVFYLFLGILAGYLIRDIGWFLAIGKTWPFSLKVTDWDEVQKLAAEKDVA